MSQDIYQKFMKTILDWSDFDHPALIQNVVTQKGFNPNHRNEEGLPLLSSCVSLGKSMAVVVLVDHPLTNLNERSGEVNETALHRAAVGQPAIGKHLLERQADPSIQDAKGETCLHVAVRFTEKERLSESFLRDLLKNTRIDLFAKNKCGETAYDIANDAAKEILSDDRRIQRWLKKHDRSDELPKVDKSEPQGQGGQQGQSSQQDGQDGQGTSQDEMGRQSSGGRSIGAGVAVGGLANVFNDQANFEKNTFSDQLRNDVMNKLQKDFKVTQNDIYDIKIMKEKINKKVLNYYKITTARKNR